MAGVEDGTWEGETAADALAAKHRSTGHDVRVVGGSLVFPSRLAREALGDVDEWIVEPLNPPA